MAADHGPQIGPRFLDVTLPDQHGDRIDLRGFEDFAVDQTFDLGEYDMTEEAIMQFAHQFDPQLFHLDADAAKSGPYGALTASGWHTASSFVRLFVDTVLLKTNCLGSPGVDELRWLKPVAPGRLKGTASVDSVKRSERTLTRGTVVVQLRPRR